jgi:hypothetical protein
MMKAFWQNVECDDEIRNVQEFIQLLDDLQRDQSKVQLDNCPSFIVSYRINDQWNSAWLCIIMTKYIKGEYGVLQMYSKFCVDTKEVKYKVISQFGIVTMEHVFIYLYASFRIGVLLLIGSLGSPSTRSDNVHFGKYCQLNRHRRCMDDHIVGVWLELIPGHPMSSQIVFVNPHREFQWKFVTVMSSNSVM